MLKLTEDIKSHYRVGVIYGKRGEEVTLVSRHDNVVLVENKSGTRYSVRAEQVSGLPEENIDEAAPGTAAIDNTALVPSKGGAAKQQSFF